MDIIEDKKLDQLLSIGDNRPITPEHRTWMNAEIEKTLAKKKSGKAIYTLLDQARREFGLDAS